MERSLLLVPFFTLLIGAEACQTGDNVAPATSNLAPDATPTMSTRLRIRVGSETFPATLLDNPTAAAFKARLPLTVSMTELNGNEKYCDLPANLPTNSANPGTIQAGDLMLYGSSTLVLFYQTFATTYRYTRLGRLDNPAVLAAALGSGSTTVTFELQ